MQVLPHLYRSSQYEWHLGLAEYMHTETCWKDLRLGAPGTHNWDEGCRAHLGVPVAVEPGCGTGPHVTGLSAGGPRGTRRTLPLVHFITVAPHTANLPAPLAPPAPH